jgi:hypothetical protein
VASELKVLRFVTSRNDSEGRSIRPEKSATRTLHINQSVPSNAAVAKSEKANRSARLKIIISRLGWIEGRHTLRRPGSCVPACSVF